MQHTERRNLLLFVLAAGVVWSDASLATTTTNTSAPTVAQGCAIPTVSASQRNFYIDPVHGNINNDGSAAKPWDTLANVIAKKKSLLRGGDILNLMSGNHGAVSIQNMANSDFITVQAASGQTPILNRLTVRGGQKWVFQGLKIQSLKTQLFSVGTSSTGVVSNNVIFKGNTLSAADDVSQWTKTDWQTNAASAIIVDGRPDVVDAASPKVNNVAQSHHSTNCITILNNSISHVNSAVGMNADHSLFSGNTINEYVADAIDYSGNNLTLSYNTITNVMDRGDGIHNDGMQGFLPGGTGYNAVTFSNVVIDHNTIIRQVNPNLPLTTYMQGIDNFDGGGYRDWYNLQVTNNLIVTNEWNCITFGGIHNSTINHNTCLADGVKTWAVINGKGVAPVEAPGNVANINLNDYNHFSQKSSNVSVTDNVAVAIGGANATDPSDIFSHNVALSQISLYTNGKVQWYSKAGTYGNSNILDPKLLSYLTNVTTVNTPNGPMSVYDATWKTGSPYMGLGGTGATATAAVTPPAYSGTITIYGNARQDGTPKLVVAVNGVTAGTASVTADVHVGQKGVYTINYTSATKPQKVDVTLDGYTSTEQKSVAVDAWNLDFTENGGKATDLIRTTTVPEVVKSGQATASKTSGVAFYTNGSTVEFDVSKL